MSCIISPCEIPRLMQARGADPYPESSREYSSGLRDLIRSNDAFLSHLEAIHYLGFPDF